MGCGQTKQSQQRQEKAESTEKPESAPPRPPPPPVVDTAAANASALTPMSADSRSGTSPRDNGSASRVRRDSRGIGALDTARGGYSSSPHNNLPSPSQNMSGCSLCSDSGALGDSKADSGHGPRIPAGRLSRQSSMEAHSKSLSVRVDKLTPREDRRKSIMRGVFAQVDTDRSGSIDSVELRILLVVLGWPSGPKDVAAALEALDPLGTGRITETQFQAWSKVGWSHAHGRNTSEDSRHDDDALVSRFTRPHRLA